jgi:hypothetical protein
MMPWLMPWVRPKKGPVLGTSTQVCQNILATIHDPKTWEVLVRLRRMLNALSLEGFDCDISAFFV